MFGIEFYDNLGWAYLIGVVAVFVRCCHIIGNDETGQYDVVGHRMVGVFLGALVTAAIWPLFIPVIIWVTGRILFELASLRWNVWHYRRLLAKVTRDLAYLRQVQAASQEADPALDSVIQGMAIMETRLAENLRSYDEAKSRPPGR